MRVGQIWTGSINPCLCHWTTNLLQPCLVPRSVACGWKVGRRLQVTRRVDESLHRVLDLGLVYMISVCETGT